MNVSCWCRRHIFIRTGS